MPVNAATLKTMEIETTAAYLRGLRSMSDPVYSRIATTVPMTTKSMDAPIMGQLGPLREWVGPRVLETLEANGYTIKAKKFEKTVYVPLEAVEDDTWGVWMPQMQDLGNQAGAWPDQQVITKLAAGATDLCYDGLPFFSASHPTNNVQKAFSNLTGSGSPAWYLFDTTKSIKPMFWGLYKAPVFTNRWSPTDDNVFWEDQLVSGVRARGVADFGFPQFAYKLGSTLDATNWETALTNMMSLLNAKDENLGCKPNLALIPPILKPAADKLWGREKLATGEDNIHYKAIEYVVCQRLSNANV
jgi:phage major head subunit gpT-like protein